MTSQAATQLNCSQCGGELHPDEGQVFITCPYCAATIYLDKSRVVFHWYVAPTLNEQQAVAALYRWMSGSQTVKDLDKKARIVGQTFQYFPVWYFKMRAADNREDILLQPAAATSVTELARLQVPAGDLRKYDASLDAQAVEPTVPLETGLEWARRSLPAPGETGGGLNEASLVHVPVYFFKYAFRDQTYTAVVDAASGTVWANLFPAKQESPYLVVGIVTALVYLCLALVPLVAWGTGDETSASIGIAICTGAGAIAAPILFAWAFYVASRV
jgi:predicted RNA-binding Zn-ribbon protein involved in translation (DUF1610 family)